VIEEATEIYCEATKLIDQNHVYWQRFNNRWSKKLLKYIVKQQVIEEATEIFCEATKLVDQNHVYWQRFNNKW
jgi:hypothetical protein